MVKNTLRNLEKNGNTWYFVAMVNGRRIKKSLATASIVDAKVRRDECLKQIFVNGDIPRKTRPSDDPGLLFGEASKQWVKITEPLIKLSTMTDYRYSMNRYILPRFGNTPIREIGYLDIREFISELTCSKKRINNILVPMRSVLKMAFLSEIIEKNPMDRVKNVKTVKPDIYPMSMEEVMLFLANVSQPYRCFFIVAFYTGMRFGEMAVLKWRNVDFKLGVIKVRETRVMGEEGSPKTRKSIRDVIMVPPVRDALKNDHKETFSKSDYVFRNQYGKPLDPQSVNFHVWKPALKKAGLEARSLYQTRHTFATLMLDAGEHPGWVQKMMGHETMQMIYEKYYSYIRNYGRDEGSAFMEKVYNPSQKIN